MAKTTLTIKLELSSDNAADLRTIAKALADDQAQSDIADLAAATLRTYIGSVTTIDDYDLTATVTPPAAGRPGRRAGGDPIPVVRDDVWQFFDVNENRVTIQVNVDSADWFNLLETERSFRYESKAGTFTATKESNGKWYARRSIQGKLRKRYLGKSEAMTAKKMWSVAHKLSQLELPPGGK